MGCGLGGLENLTALAKSDVTLLAKKSLDSPLSPPFTKPRCQVLPGVDHAGEYTGHAPRVLRRTGSER